MRRIIGNYSPLDRMCAHTRSIAEGVYTHSRTAEGTDRRNLHKSRNDVDLFAKRSINLCGLYGRCVAFTTRCGLPDTLELS